MLVICHSADLKRPRRVLELKDVNRYMNY